ncbi:hypothetical protein KCU88_g1719, partial [Aureobasidium melanogenum]
MTRRDSHSSTERPDTAASESPPASPSMSRRSTEPVPTGHRERRDSKLGRIVDSIRSSISQEHGKLFGDKSEHHHKKYQATVAERLEKLREQDQTRRKRVEEEMASEPEINETVSPAIEARERSEVNENNMGPTSHERVRRDSWGWPGLGTYEPQPASLDDDATPRRKSSMKMTKEQQAALRSRTESATYEAIDNAAEAETFGWPGLGDFPSRK